MKYDAYYFIEILNFLFFLSLFPRIKSKKLRNLRENETIQKYINIGVNDTYQILLKKDDDTRKIIIDLMIFSGDAILLLNETNPSIRYYQIGNKIFYYIYVDKNESQLHDYLLNVCALKNSYYSVRYTLEKRNIKDSKNFVIIPNNANFLLTINPNDEYIITNKKIKLMNEKNSSSLLVNFNFINCVGKIFRRENVDNSDDDIQALNSNDDYYIQDIKKYDDSKKYDYEILIYKVEQGSYEHRMCMVYISNMELAYNGIDGNLSQSILVGENIPQKIIFDNNITSVKYLYQIPDINNNLAIKFIFFKKAKYIVYFYIKNHEENYKYLKNITIFSDGQEIIESSDYNNKCENGQECALLVEIKLFDDNIKKDDLELEISIKSLSTKEKYPSYLIKNKINSDYLNINSPNYYYTDIGQKIAGEITINFYRGDGVIFGSIVKKDNSEISNQDWMGSYKFPSTLNDSILFVSYLKKLIFTANDTSDCVKGCYLLITVVHNDTLCNPHDDNNDSRYFGYDISVFTESNSISEIPRIVDLPLEKYVLGSTSGTENSNYYMITIPYDAEKVIFDIQGENLLIFISIYKSIKVFNDYKYPSETFHHWKFYTYSKLSLLSITKKEITDILKEYRLIKTLEGIILTISINQRFKENTFKSIYTLKYHLEYIHNNFNFNIYEVYCDQQVLCNTSYITDTNKFQCLYMIKYNKDDEKYKLIIYPILEDKSTDFSIYAKFIPKEYYDLQNFDELQNLIPNKNSDYSSDSINEEFLYINLNDRDDHYLFINIETDNNTTMSLLSTLTTFDYSSVPNPSTSKLFLIKDNDIKFSFDLREDLLINIATIKGHGKINWEGENISHSLSGRDDSISLTTSKIIFNNNSNYECNILDIKNERDNENSQLPNSLLIYLSFNMRSPYSNFDEFQLGKSFNLIYRNTYFPITIYIINFRMPLLQYIF